MADQTRPVYGLVPKVGRLRPRIDASHTKALNRVAAHTREPVAGHTHAPSDTLTTGVGSEIVVHCFADATVNNTTTNFLPVHGISMSVEDNSMYVIDGWATWESNSAADIRFQWSGVSFFGGMWSMHGPVRDQAPVNASSPRQNYIDTGTVPITSSLAFAGDNQFPGTVFASGIIRGFITTGTIGTGFLLSFAQATADASDTTVKEGSWLRVTRVA
jgi:hypothetical protein